MNRKFFTVVGSFVMAIMLVPRWMVRGPDQDRPNSGFVGPLWVEQQGSAGNWR